ncbi:hypothetical protein GGP41_001836 [Bipolaris sorokiniana]|uniref:Rhodopsin domain-containing protein n=1 Tax=Cochliobolus sativus TaxID=45130 RepID=A0A8H5ZPL0_COCSA|nr:hypothetical protein GGP41_001836 [Bipolaris sorokiniana]
MTSDNRKQEVLAVAILFFVLTWVTVCLRVYVRLCLRTIWGKDDSYMVATQLVFTVYLCFQIVAAVHGTGQHRWRLSDHDAKTALLFWYLCEVMYVVTNGLLKFSIGYFYLRVAVKRNHIWCIRILMGGTVLCCLIYLFLVMLQCSPVSAFWEIHPASSKCIPKGPTLGISYALAAINAAADWILGLLPFWMVWGLNMKTKTKIVVACILAFAAIGSTGTVVRMGYIHTLYDGPDFLYATTDVAIWSTVEPGIGIVASSIATYRPLVYHILQLLGFADAPYEQSTSFDYTGKGRDYRRSLSVSDLVPTEMGIMTSHVTGPAPTGWGGAPRTPKIDISDEILPHTTTPDNQILQTVSVHQQSEGPPKLELRASFHNNLARGSMFSLGRFRISE